MQGEIHVCREVGEAVWEVCWLLAWVHTDAAEVVKLGATMGTTYTAC